MPLRDQDRTRWDRTLIEEGHAIVRACIRRGRPGPFQLQAAIQPVHCDAASFEDKDCQQIVAVYHHLHSFLPTPVVALNRAIAVGEADGPAAALAGIDAVYHGLEDYHLMHAARGSALRRLGRRGEGDLRTRRPPRTKRGRPAFALEPDPGAGRRLRTSWEPPKCRFESALKVVDCPSQRESAPLGLDRASMWGAR